jgi:hypothetical protein
MEMHLVYFNPVLYESCTDLLVLLISALWLPSSDATTNKKIQQFANDQVGTAIDQAAKKKGLLQRFRYANYAASSQKVVQSYGLQNEAFLKSAAKDVDPRGVFQTRVGGFKLY